MIGILVSGHGKFASGLTTALELLAGPQAAYQAVDFLPEHSADELKENMKRAMEELGACDSVLIHGQVAMVWTNTVGATRILVANDEALKDEMTLSGLKMAKPAGVNLSIATVARAAKRLKENAYPGERVFVITKNIADMAKLIREGVEIGGVNVGNVAKREGSRNIKKSVYLKLPITYTRGIFHG